MAVSYPVRMPSAHRRHARRRTRIALVVMLVVFVNLPLAHSSWTRWQIDRNGVDGTAEVVATDLLSPEDGADHWVSFRYPEDVDPDQEIWPAQVDRVTFEEAEESGEIGVRYLEDDPSAYVVDGEVRNGIGLIVTLGSDAVLLVVLLLFLRFGGRGRRP